MKLAANPHARRPVQDAIVFACVLAAVAVQSRDARAYGEGVNGFPTWEERVLHEWTNRARSQPAAALAGCAQCPDAACYTAVAPLRYDVAINRASRFHAQEMQAQGYLAHDSQCELVSNINSLYPGTCTGQASCACVGGAQTCPCTNTFQRIALFGVNGASGEILASGFTTPDAAFTGWLHEPTASPVCEFSITNGHRWTILKSMGRTGYGVHQNLYVGEFATTGAAPKIPSGSHFPRQGGQPTPVSVWANWFDASPPSNAFVNVDGTCTALTLARGTQTNGAWTATLGSLDGACHRYFFSFRDANGTVVTYPDTGSLGIGAAGTCADFDTSRPSNACASAAAAVPATRGWALPALLALLLLASAIASSGFSRRTFQ